MGSRGGQRTSLSTRRPPAGRDAPKDLASSRRSTPSFISPMPQLGAASARFPPHSVPLVRRRSPYRCCSWRQVCLSLTHPFLPYVAPHFSHISHFILFISHFILFCSCPPLRALVLVPPPPIAHSTTRATRTVQAALNPPLTHPLTHPLTLPLTPPLTPPLVLPLTPPLTPPLTHP